MNIYGGLVSPATFTFQLDFSLVFLLQNIFFCRRRVSSKAMRWCRKTGMLAECQRSSLGRRIRAFFALNAETCSMTTAAEARQLQSDDEESNLQMVKTFPI